MREKKATNARARNESNAFSNSVLSQLCCFGFLVDTWLLTSAALLLCQQYRRFIFPLWPAGIVVGVGCPDTSHWGMTSQKIQKKKKKLIEQKNKSQTKNFLGAQ